MTRRPVNAVGLQGSDMSRLTPAAMVFWQPPKGLNVHDPLSRLDAQELGPASVNFRLDRGTMVVRPAISYVWNQPLDGPLVDVVYFEQAVTGGAGMLAFTPTYAYYSWGVWRPIVLTPLNGTRNGWIAHTGWAEKLLVTNGVDVIMEFDMQARTLTPIVGSPPARHLTTFDGRVVASAPVMDGKTQRSRIAWCVKDDSHDWTGVGSGYEDLLAPSGGFVDEVMGVVPVTDDQALVVRSNSVWIMATTGDVDAPFRFMRLHDRVPTQSRRTLTAVPGGAVYMTTRDVLLVSLNSVQPLGGKLRPWIEGALNKQNAVGAYDPERGDYVLGIQRAAGSRLDTLLRYSFADDGWTEEEVPGEGFTSLTFARVREGYTPITTLTGTISEMGTGAIQDIGITKVYDGLIFGGASTVLMESDTAEDNDGSGAASTEVEAVAYTGLVYGEDVTYMQEVVEVLLEYESPVGDVSVTLDCSPDGGLTWHRFGTKSLSATNGVPTLVSWTGVQTGNSLLFKLSVVGAPGFRLIQMIPKITKGGSVFA